MSINPVGKNFISISLQGGSFNQLIAPSANTAGIYIRTGWIGQIAASGASPSFTWITSSATTPGSGNTNTLLTTMGNNSGATQMSIAYPLYIPAGLGLWGYTQGTVGAIYLTYDLVG